ncbi:hypothetical protein QCA50_008932 [Cerrena zonata]|uniref:Uncharacterized protein n=1 Tax=Cerrena zonata TaxID=2478898 RepID=A0AAW0G4D3_9APHY
MSIRGRIEERRGFASRDVVSTPPTSYPRLHQHDDGESDVQNKKTVCDDDRECVRGGQKCRGRERDKPGETVLRLLCHIQQIRIATDTPEYSQILRVRPRFIRYPWMPY